MAWLEPSPKIFPNHKGPWNVRYRVDGHIKTSGPFDVMFEAREEQTKRKKEERDNRKARRGLPVSGSNPLELFDQYIKEQIREGHMRETTAFLKRRQTEPVLEAYRRIQDMTKEEMEAWKTKALTQPTLRSRGIADRYQDDSHLRLYSPSTVSMIWRGLRTFMIWAKGKGFITVDPMAGLKTPRSRKRKDRAKSKSDIEAIIANAPNPLFRLFLTFLFFQGHRKGSTQQIECEELDLRSKLWSLPDHKTKMGYDQTIPIHPRVLACLGETFPRGVPKGFIFRGFHDPKIHHNLVRDLWYKSKLAAGITYPLTMHGARRTWATGFVKHSQSLKAMMDQGGWKDAKTAMDYQQFEKGWLKKVNDTFDYHDEDSPDLGVI